MRFKKTIPDVRIVNGDSDPGGGCQTILHVERLAQVHHKGQPEVWSRQQGRAARLSLGLLEGVEGVAVTVLGAGATAEHSTYICIITKSVFSAKGRILLVLSVI